MDSVEMVDPRILVINPLREKARTIPNKEHGRYLMIRDSIVANGIKTPILVQRNTNMIIGGHTRCEIAIDLGFPSVPVQYVDVDDDQAEYMLIEDNLDRAQDEKDLMKVAWQCSRLKELEGIEQGRPKKTRHDVVVLDSIAAKLNMSSRTFQRYISLNKLIPSLQKLVSDGKIGIAAGSILSRLSKEGQENVFDSIKELSVSKTYNMTKQDAEGFRKAFGRGDEDEASDSDIVQGVNVPGDEEFYLSSEGGEETAEDHSEVDVKEALRSPLDSLAIKVSNRNIDVLGVASEVEQEFTNRPMNEEDHRERLLATQKGVQEKLQSLLSIEDAEARQAFAVSKMQSAIRTYQLALERAEIELVTELAILTPQNYEDVLAPWEQLVITCERVAKKLATLLDQMQNDRVQ
ncbi:ParB/RepB/Spo0J family partition protein [Alicyclobacillus suci]|uniref:ParB/RepB/Spo0J family partition protein n=1 Tax=Alicyclobacillus suci TaxID=2816080 RepID=UPI001A8E9870|nr:ParB/RepB/Spo0J family partition protein [Alicyclobacillus suci]